MIKSEIVINELDKLFPNAKCELLYEKDYELLIATVLSAQCTDKRVNEVVKVLWKKYDLITLKEASLKDIENIIKPCGTYTKKARYLKSIAEKLIKESNGVVPNDRKYLESLPGVGRKTCNVVLSNLYDVPAIAVDTHVQRVSKRLGLVNDNDNVYKIELRLMKKFPKDKWNKLHHELVLFGRYKCKALKPECDLCPFKDYCRYFKKINNML